MKKVIIALVGAAVLSLACGEEEGVTPPPGSDRVGATTPAYVLKNVVVSFNQRDINLLKAMLSENFVFYFDPRDVGRSPPGSQYVIPESWSRDEFWQAVKNMFKKAYSINLSITTSGVGTPAENETTYLADNVPISLLVMVDELSGYIADKGYCNFEFEKYTTAAGKKYWRLSGWWDHTSEFFDGYTGASPPSLGKVLAIFM
jgi:hypothetical protein